MAGLEDHAGDMVRKSRVGLGIAAEEVATLLGWSFSALKTFEDEGVASATEPGKAFANNWILMPTSAGDFAGLGAFFCQASLAYKD